MKIFKQILVFLVAVLLGLGLGFYFFKDTKPRDFVKVKNCTTNCYSQKDLLGLMASIGFQKLANTFPKDMVILETDKTIVVKHPSPDYPIHYLAIPKIDLRNIGELDEASKPYLDDAIGSLVQIVHDENLVKYKIVTNGPGFQDMAYWHFHLMGRK